MKVLIVVIVGLFAPFAAAQVGTFSTESTCPSLGPGVQQRHVAVILAKFNNLDDPLNSEFPTMDAFKQHLRTVYFGSDLSCPPVEPVPMLQFDRFNPLLPFTDRHQRGYPITADHPSLDGQWWEASYHRVHATGDVYGPVVIPTNKSCSYPDKNALQAVVNEAANANQGDFGKWKFDHVVVITKADPSCKMGGVGWRQTVSINLGGSSRNYDTAIAWNQAHIFGERLLEEVPGTTGCAPSHNLADYIAPDRVPAVNQATHEAGHGLSNGSHSLDQNHEGWALYFQIRQNNTWLADELLRDVDPVGTWMCPNGDYADIQTNWCEDVTTHTNERSSCKVIRQCYGDVMTPTGGGYLVHHSAPDKNWIGWLKTSELIDIAPWANTGTWTLSAYENLGGIKALRIRRFGGAATASADSTRGAGTQYLWVEFRRPTKTGDLIGNYDQYQPNFRFPPRCKDGTLASGADPDRYPKDPEGSWIHLSTDKDGNQPFLLDNTSFSPTKDAQLKAGEEWRDPHGDVVISISNAPALTDLRVNVTYPCYPRLKFNGQEVSDDAPIVHDASGGRYSISVTVPANCTWDDRLTLYPLYYDQIFADRPVADTTTGQLRYTLLENTTGVDLEEYIRIRGRFVDIVQRAYPTTTRAVLTTTASSTVTFGTLVPLTLTVTQALGGYYRPTGTVDFREGASGGGTLLGTVSGTSPFVFNTSSLGIGTHRLQARYNGDSHNLPADSQNFIEITVIPVVPAQTLTGRTSAKSGPANARVWSVEITNSGTSPAVNTRVDTFSLTQTSGAACTPVIVTPRPVVIGTIAPATAGTAAVTINFSSCEALARFSVKATFSAGTATGTFTLNNQFR